MTWGAPGVCLGRPTTPAFCLGRTHKEVRKEMQEHALNLDLITLLHAHVIDPCTSSTVGLNNCMIGFWYLAYPNTVFDLVKHTIY